MKKIIEIFQWQYEGEYEQYFYIVEETNEEEFVKEMFKYLNTVVVKRDYAWSDSLHKFKPSKQINISFEPQSHISHLTDTYFIDYEYNNKFTMRKRCLDVKWQDIIGE